VTALFGEVKESKSSSSCQQFFNDPCLCNKSNGEIVFIVKLTLTNADLLEEVIDRRIFVLLHASTIMSLPKIATRTKGGDFTHRFLFNFSGASIPVLVTMMLRLTPSGNHTSVKQKTLLLLLPLLALSYSLLHIQNTLFLDELGQ
jgi:hypothetical protein